VILKVLKWLACSAGTVAAVLAVMWLFRSDPILMISGRALSGPELSYPTDWAFTDDYRTVAVETHPGEPHSVTTICFVYEGELYIPAQSGSKKTWTGYALEDSRVRIKVGDFVYPAKLTRVQPVDFERYRDAVGKKFPAAAERLAGDLPEDIWLFRVGPREENGNALRSVGFNLRV